MAYVADFMNLIWQNLIFIKNDYKIFVVFILVFNF